jgi:hypothetical protein
MAQGERLDHRCMRDGFAHRGWICEVDDGSIVIRRLFNSKRSIVD